MSRSPGTTIDRSGCEAAKGSGASCGWLERLGADPWQWAFANHDPITPHVAQHGTNSGG
jgi:hypothetical protein